MSTVLDRTWYNTLTDDDGSNTIGTVWNKAAVDSLMDAIDALFTGAVSLVGPLNVTSTGASTGVLVGAAAGNWGARFSRSAGGSVLIGTPGTTSADHLTIVTSAGTDILDITGDRLIKFSGYTGTTFVAGDKYLVIDASGNIHRSAIGPAS